MRRSFFFLALLVWIVAHCGQEKVDPLLRLLVSAYRELGPMGLRELGLGELAPMEFPPGGGPLVRVILWTEGPGEARGLPAFSPSTVLGELATGLVPLPELAELADDPRLVYVRAARPLRPSLDISVPEVRAPEVWYGDPPTRGEGALVGIVDTGIDLLHRAFRVDRDGDGLPEGSKVLWLWDQTAGGFPGEWGLTYGEVYSREEIEYAISLGVPPEEDASGHGTHVAGIAAGGEPGLPGVAPGADLVVVKTSFYEDTVVDGVAFVFRVAEEYGLPAVVNLSLGGHAGPHDGTSLFETAVDATLDRAGRAVVVAAGNEGGSRIHVGAEVPSPVVWHISVGSPSGAAQFWHSPAASFTVEVVGPEGASLAVPPGSTGSLTSAGGRISLDNASGGPHPRNGDMEVYLLWYGLPIGSTISVRFIPSPSGGRIDGWIESSDYGQFLEGDGTMTIAEPGNAERVITVGAYTTRTHWESSAGTQSSDYDLWDIAPFSSKGPTRDGRIKPDLSAPGAWILSARSRAASARPWLLSPDGEHMYLAGTSMAAPHVAGACALLLSLEPGLSHEELKAALVQGAREDAYTGMALPDWTWGYGKLDVAGARGSLPTGGARAGVPLLRLLTNPVRDEAVFRYELPEGTGWAELRVYDILGRLLTQIPLPVEGLVHRWDLSTPQGELANGLYFVVIVADTGVSSPVRLVVWR